MHPITDASASWSAQSTRAKLHHAVGPDAYALVYAGHKGSNACIAQAVDDLLGYVQDPFLPNDMAALTAALSIVGA